MGPAQRTMGLEAPTPWPHKKKPSQLTEGWAHAWSCPGATGAQEQEVSLQLSQKASNLCFCDPFKPSFHKATGHRQW